MGYKFVVSVPRERKAYQIEVDDISPIIGKKIGDRFDGSVIGLDGYVLEIRGGTDKDGFPMTNWIDGPGRKRLLLSRGPGIHLKKKGLRKRKMVRGNTVSEEIAQINVVVREYGQKTVAEMLGKGEGSGEQNDS